MEKFIALFDIHMGWELKRVRGEQVVVPTMNEKAIKIALDFANDFKPDIIIFGGDQLNCKPISHWDKHSPGRIGNFTVKDELDAFNDIVLDKLRFKHKVRRIWHKGNHEAWMDQLLDSNPGIKGLVSIESYLGLPRRGFELYDSGEVSQTGKINWLHGDIIPGGVNVARVGALRFNSNIRFGHYHCYQTYTLHNPVDVTDVRTSTSLPCLASRSPDYGQNAPNQWVNGFSYGWIKDNGNFNDYVVVIADDCAVIDGREYIG